MPEPLWVNQRRFDDAMRQLRLSRARLHVLYGLRLSDPSPFPLMHLFRRSPASPEERGHARRRLAEIKAGLKKEASA